MTRNTELRVFGFFVGFVVIMTFVVPALIVFEHSDVPIAAGSLLEGADSQLSEVQQLKAEKFQLSRSSFAARLEKAQNDAKRQAEEQLKAQLEKINQQFQGELQKLEQERVKLEADFRLTLKPKPETLWDWGSLSFKAEPKKLGPAKPASK